LQKDYFLDTFTDFKISKDDCFEENNMLLVFPTEYFVSILYSFLYPNYYSDFLSIFCLEFHSF